MERVSSIFSQVVRLVPRGLFDEAVSCHQGEKHAKGMTRWSQFVAMQFCHLGGARSLREITCGLAASEGKLRHLGVQQPPTRSTLSYANEHRSWKIYEDVFKRLVSMCQSEARGQKARFRFKHALLSLDSTTIPLCLSMFEWANYVRTKGAVKLHLVLDKQGFLPQYAVLSEGRQADVKVARQMEFQPGTMLVFDRGYEDHNWWRKLTAGGVDFVTRLKDSTDYTIVEERPVQKDCGIIRDEVIVLDSEKDPDKPMRLRRIEVWMEDKQDTTAFVTNNPKLAASTIAAIYRDRWKIELFFKAIKQSLRIKTFIGTSENAVRIQIWTALISMLLLRYLNVRSTWRWSFSNMVALLRQQIFVYRDLWKLLDQPGQPPVDLDDVQLGFDWQS
jgi:hypothetical protein